MTLTHFTTDLDADGILLVTWDSPDKSMNVISTGVMAELETIVERIATDAAVKGAVVTSGKKDFSGGADLDMLKGAFETYRTARARDPEAAAQALFAESRKLSQIYRRLETCGKPVVVAINGTAMGGAFELALAAHGRVAAEGDYKVGLPEVKVGLFPGAGGTVRVMRMVDTQSALQFLLQGQTVAPAKAKAMGLLDQVVPAGELIASARALAKTAKPVKPWDENGYRLQGAQNVFSPAGFGLWPAANALYRKETNDNYPGARAVMHVAFESLQLPFDTALTVESRHFAHVLTTPQAAAMIRSLFVSMQDLGKGARRPKDQPKASLKKVGVVGAGFMGAGIAYVTARAGIDVVLLDRDQAAADKGKAHSDGLLAKSVGRGSTKPEEKDAILARIHPTANYADLKGCDLVVEAVFEDRQVKMDAFAKVAAATDPDMVFASNTSTLPITSLSSGWAKPENFIGIHFFSPVDKMMLVEIILGEKTSDRALATALDFVRAIKRTPIVVNDSRGFYANRCVLNYILEGHLMVAEGVPPAMIETVAKGAGMPVGPLALNDEVALDLAWKILQATKTDLGDAAIDPRQEKLLKDLVVDRERFGRKNGKGFYDYSGKEKRLWPGLAEIVEQKPADAFDRDELRDRLLVTQALEAARTVEDGVVTDPREADVGSILGWGFAPYTGGTLSFIDTMGTKRFVELADRLAATHGERFAAPKLLRDMAAKGETFYGRMSGTEAKKSAA